MPSHYQSVPPTGCPYLLLYNGWALSHHSVILDGPRDSNEQKIVHCRPRADTPIIMMTGPNDRNAVGSIREKGLTLHIDKPLDPVRYEAMVAAVLPPDKVTYRD